MVEEINLPSLRTVVVRVPLVLSTVVLVIKTLHVLLGMTLSLDSVVFVEALGFDELVDFSADEADESLFSEGVGDWLSCIIVSIAEYSRSERKGRRRRGAYPQRGGGLQRP